MCSEKETNQSLNSTGKRDTILEKQSQVLERFIAKLRETLFLVIKQRPLKPPKYNRGPRMRKALDALQRQKQFLVFRKADKGYVIVVENVDDYIENRREHLADPHVYQRLDRDGRELAQAIKQAVKLRLRRLHTLKNSINTVFPHLK